MIGTVRGTIAPFRYSFLEAGFEAGFVSGQSDVGYYSFCPFIHKEDFRDKTVTVTGQSPLY